MTPSAFIFLYENQLFLTFRNRTVAVWNFRGELVTSFEDHLLWHPDCNTNNIYITSDQDLIISYCKADSDDPLSEGNGNFFFIQHAICIARIQQEIQKCSLLIKLETWSPFSFGMLAWCVICVLPEQILYACDCVCLSTIVTKWYLLVAFSWDGSVSLKSDKLGW